MAAPAAPAPAAPRLRRTWPQRLLIAFNLLLISACVAAATGIGYFYYQFGQLPRISFAANVLTPDAPPGEPQNFLLVGSDTRDFVDSDDDAQSFGGQGSTGPPKSDTIILVRIDPRTQRAAMVSFPRDLWIPIAPDGHQQRINTAFSAGPEALVETIKLNWNVPIHHYMQVDFKGFQGLVDAVGGVEIYLPGPVRDKVTGLNITDTGCVLFHGDQSLAYVRSRHFEYMEDGRWRSDPSGDLGRIVRQQDFIRRAMRKALSSGLTNPTRLNRLVNVGIDNVAVDDSLSARDIVNLGKHFRSLTPDTLAQYQLPVVNAGRTVGGQRASVVVIPESEQGTVERIMDVFRGVEAPAAGPVSPGEVTVRVLNGSGRTGEATRTTEALQGAGFQTSTPGDASRTGRTTIRYGSEQAGKAQLLERYLEAGADLVEDPALQGVDVVLVTGEDFTGVLDEPRPAEAAPPPTDPPTTDEPAEPAEPDC
ncbi:MAG TPA: LCP family protein [Acidimicrobiales bacterium]|nr:LCP family protein [Acidimicrobiales bacterium]